MLVTNFSPVFFSGQLFTTDIDGTFLIGRKDNPKRNVEDREYDVESAKKVFQAVRDNGYDDVLINTGRNFTELSEIKDILKGLDAPISAISLEDGKRLLKKPVNLTPEQWMAQLFGGKTDYKYYSDKNWSSINNAPLKKIGEYLVKEEGFCHRKDNGENSIFVKDIAPEDIGVEKLSDRPKWKVEIVPPGITVKISIYPNSEGSKINLQKYNDYLSKKIYEMLKQNGFDITALDSEKETSYTNQFQRGDINKGTVANYLKSTFEEETEEVRAGNAINDLEMLDNDDIHSIVVGDDKELKKALSGRKNVFYAEEGKLDEAIYEVSKKLK